MKVLVIGGGGREHALVWALSKSKLVEEIHVAPGNAGMRGVAFLHSVHSEGTEEILDLATQID
ncbi:MAG TPA: phosphoribosylamine--glycine ligase, partial [Aminobacterium sp.]|nr:phosphoribosylamine--glycine ligase [Aminobacterium sp.]